MLLSQISPTCPLCQILRGGGGGKPKQKKTKQNQTSSPGKKGRRPKARASKATCHGVVYHGGSGSRGKGQEAVPGQAAAGSWHQGIPVLRSSRETLYYSRNDLRKGDQPGQQNTCRAGQNAGGGKGRVFPLGGRAPRIEQGEWTGCRANGDFLCRMRPSPEVSGQVMHTLAFLALNPGALCACEMELRAGEKKGSKNLSVLSVLADTLLLLTAPAESDVPVSCVCSEYIPGSTWRISSFHIRKVFLAGRGGHSSLRGFQLSSQLPLQCLGTLCHRRRAFCTVDPFLSAELQTF